MEKALAEHVACHPEDAGRTVKDFSWIAREIVQWPRPNPMPADEISEAEISAAAARNEITKGEIEDGFFIPLDGPSETLEPIDLPPPDPGCLARSKPWPLCIKIMMIGSARQFTHLPRFGLRIRHGDLNLC